MIKAKLVVPTHVGVYRTVASGRSALPALSPRTWGCTAGHAFVKVVVELSPRTWGFSFPGAPAAACEASRRHRAE